MKDFVVKAGTYKNINCKFHGFVNDKKQIYQSIDVLLHFNKVEALGRIVMEALDFGIPFSVSILEVLGSWHSSLELQIT